MRPNASPVTSGPTSVPGSRGSPIGTLRYAVERRSSSASAIDSWTIRRRSEVHRCPAVPTAAKRTPRTTRSRSALGATIAALLPPSSRSDRPRRDEIRGAIALPIAVEPVAETSGIRSSSASWTARSAPPITSSNSPSGVSPKRAAARSRSAVVAIAVSGVRSEGFQITGSPQTSASAAFQLQTATGKLKALITATGPSGCHVSVSRCPGRSEAIERPYSWRERPTAKSQMSIISWTSPRPSWEIFPTSSVTSAPSASFSLRSSSPSRRTSSPRRGAGTSRHALEGGDRPRDRGVGAGARPCGQRARSPRR